MQDDQHGLKDRAPFKDDQRFVLLAPQNESYAGPQYDHNPVSAGGVPEDPLGFFPEGTSTEDEVFRTWPEEGRPTVANYELTRDARYGNVVGGRSRQLPVRHLTKDIV